MPNKIIGIVDALKKKYGSLNVNGTNVVCKNCKNSKVVIVKDGKTYEYSYDENGKETIEIK
jgi:hypothetical protein